MVAEQFRLVVGERISKRICEQIADVYTSQVVEQIIEVPKMAQILDVLVLETMKQSVKLPSTVSDDGTQQRTAECIADIPVPQDVKELVEVSEVFPRTNVNSVFGSRSMKLLMFPSLRRSLRGLSLRRNRL